MRGEKFTIDMEGGHTEGSPPHARGKGSGYRYRCQCHGITPACAGKSERFQARFLFPEDHPRMRGEKLTTYTVDKGEEGLSGGAQDHPRMRGEKQYLI